MEPYDPGRYGEHVGDYDALYPGIESETLAAVDFLARLAQRHPGPSIVEFGIGTGRLALPLAAAGVTVAGIDGSEQMVAQLRAKHGGEELRVEVGDYRHSVVAPQAFGVVVLALNGIFDPRGVDAQLDIFRNAGAHLMVGGFFVVETWVLHDEHRRGDWTVAPRYVGHEHVEFQLARYDVQTNRIHRTLLHLRGSKTDFVTVTDTYASPEALDVMGVATGFERVARHSSWSGSDFSAASTTAISVYQLMHTE